MTAQWHSPKLDGLLGFILVAAPSLFFFFAGMPGTQVTETEFAGGNRIAPFAGSYSAFNRRGIQDGQQEQIDKDNCGF